MVMRLHTGVPGSGKTYLLMDALTSAYYTFNKELQHWDRKEEYKDLTLISNIEGLNLEHKDLELMMQKRCEVLAKKKAAEMNINDADVIEEYYQEYWSEKIRWFFNYDYQKRLSEHFGSIVYAIEEAQRYFDAKEISRKPWARDVFYFFEKHRHFGMSIYMDTQHVCKICKDLAVLFEAEVQAKPRTMSMTGEMRYNELVEGMKVNQVPIVKRPKKSVFSSYKSMHQKEVVKTKKPLLRLVAFVLIVAVAAYFVLQYAKAELGPDEAIAAEAVKDSPVQTGEVEKVPLKEVSPVITGKWHPVSYIASGSGFLLLNPIDQSVVKLREFPYKLRRSGNKFYAWIENDELQLYNVPIPDNHRPVKRLR